MTQHHLAGQRVPESILVDLAALEAAYFETAWEADNPSAQVSFGTSGHRGTSLDGSFSERQIFAIAQSICDYRKMNGIDGPLFLGKDTHALSGPAFVTVLEVFAANGVEIFYQENEGFTPTPVVSYSILQHNKSRNKGTSMGLADGVILTPSHNPPEDGGIKYNPPSGGPADTSITLQIENRSNELLRAGLRDVKRMDYKLALRSANVHAFDYVQPYVENLDRVIDMKAIAASGLRIGADPLGGAGIGFWGPIAERYKLDLTIVNEIIDPTFSFMRVDRDGKVRMDCSSPMAMAGLIEYKDSFDISFGNDPDFDRHGIVTRSHGLLNPNHYLAVAIDYIFRHRNEWSPNAAIGKTLVSSSMIDRVGNRLGKRVIEVPVGFKWFVDGLLTGALGFAGEESAGASFLKKDGTVWTTDKDGIILNLLSAEIMAVTEEDPGERYAGLTEEFGHPCYARSEAPANRRQKEILHSMNAGDVSGVSMAGDPILSKLTTAPGNGAPIGGLKVETANGWFAARPSGTEDIYKIYAESFVDAEHLEAIQAEAQLLIQKVFDSHDA